MSQPSSTNNPNAFSGTVFPSLVFVVSGVKGVQHLTIQIRRLRAQEHRNPKGIGKLEEKTNEKSVSNGTK